METRGMTDSLGDGSANRPILPCLPASTGGLFFRRWEPREQRLLFYAGGSPNRRPALTPARYDFFQTIGETCGSLLRSFAHRARTSDSCLARSSVQPSAFTDDMRAFSCIAFSVIDVAASSRCSASLTIRHLLRKQIASALLIEDFIGCGLWNRSTDCTSQYS